MWYIQYQWLSGVILDCSSPYDYPSMIRNMHWYNVETAYFLTFLIKYDPKACTLKCEDGKLWIFCFQSRNQQRWCCVWSLTKLAYSTSKPYFKVTTWTESSYKLQFKQILRQQLPSRLEMNIFNILATKFQGWSLNIILIVPYVAISFSKVKC